MIGNMVSEACDLDEFKRTDLDIVDSFGVVLDMMRAVLKIRCRHRRVAARNNGNRHLTRRASGLGDEEEEEEEMGKMGKTKNMRKIEQRGNEEGCSRIGGFRASVARFNAENKMGA